VFRCESGGGWSAVEPYRRHTDDEEQTMARRAEFYGRREFLKYSGATLSASFTSGCAKTGWSSPPAPQASRRPLRTGLVYSADYKRHLAGLGHPESPARLDAIVEALAPERLGIELERVPPRRATREEILYCHTAAYHDLAKREIESGAVGLSTGDTNVCRQSYEVALLAVGGVLAAVDAVMAGRVRNVFCAVRPPGHHARPAQGMGFCIFNNVAIAARYAQKKHKIGKVLIADWDVHHGNGTQDIFFEDGSVFYFSTHEWPFYPGTGRKNETGRAAGAGTTLNCPFPMGAGRKEILGAFQDQLVPAADRFKPELVIVSAGFDGRVGDLLGGFQLTDKDFADLTEVVKDIARRHARQRLVSVLEGGYDLDGLGKATAAHVRAMAGT
jgi:acetoin utilization deacetylase AcuC-like enzyme